MANGTCSVADCGKVETLRRGKCYKHYWEEHGSERANCTHDGCGTGVPPGSLRQALQAMAEAERAAVHRQAVPGKIHCVRVLQCPLQGVAGVR